MKKLFKAMEFEFNSIFNTITWKRTVKKAIRLKKKHKKDYFVVPKSKTKLGIIDGIYPFNKLFLKNGYKRLRYRDLKKQSYFNTINIQV